VLLVPGADACAELRAAAIPGVEITAAADEDGLCRVAGVARPRPNAAIGFELWLPPAPRWSGRYYQMGNGGFAGNINTPTLKATAQRGDAAAATDTGHTGTGFDASWAVGRPDLVEDYAYRAQKVTSDVAATLVRIYYGRQARHRYFMGCSNGGRQALMAAARYPEDWDGIIAGAPAADWSHQFERFAAIQKAVARPGGRIAPARLAVILAAARRECGDRATCAFRSIRLTAGERRTIRTIEQAGYPASRAMAAEWSQWIFGEDTAEQTQLAFANQAFRKLIRDDPDWSAASYDPDRDRPSAELRALLDVPDPSRFVRKGGKILSYFGWADPVIAPMAGISFYHAQTTALGGPKAQRAAWRLFMVPEMAHCQGGGPHSDFGQALIAPAPSDDPDHDIRRALERWVEQGRAPDRLAGLTPL
jgi:feruloyl esterase